MAEKYVLVQSVTSKNCSNCLGVGSLSHGTIKCKQCNGKGQYVQNIFADLKGNLAVKCEECAGTGTTGTLFNEGLKSCKTCKGEGFINFPKKVKCTRCLGSKSVMENFEVVSCRNCIDGFVTEFNLHQKTSRLHETKGYKVNIKPLLKALASY